MSSMYKRFRGTRSSTLWLTVSMFLLMALSVAALGAGPEKPGTGVPEGKPSPEMLKALEKKKREAERLRQRVKELEALLRMKNEISDAKSRAIEQLEAAKKNDARK